MMKATPHYILKLSLALVALAADLPALEVNSRGPLLNDPAREAEFMNWGLGMFVHWSLDSQLGSVISHSMVGASDKYLDRYINDLPRSFNPRDYDPDKWMEIAKLAGVNYMVFTTKHHNGFAMWDTKTTDFGIMNTPYGKDVVRQYVDACRRHGIKVGFYFSPEDFIFLHRHGETVRRVGTSGREKEALLAYNQQQLDELFGNYGPIDVVFFDGGEKELLTQYIHQLQPNCLVTRGEMETPEQHLPKEPIPGPWESCFTLGTQWQFKPTNEVYKSGGKLIEMLIETRAKGGNLLLNVGPEPSGLIPFEQERVFRELGLWMFINDEAIHDVRPCPIIGEDGLWYTQSRDGKSVYVFLTEFTGEKRWPRGERKEILLRSLRATAQTKISVLGQNDRVVEYLPDADPQSRFRQTTGGLEISVMRAQRIYNNRSWPNAVVVKLENVEFSPEAVAAAEGPEWVDLFAHDSMEQWHSGARDEQGNHREIGELWSLQDGVMSLDRAQKGRGGFIVTKKSYGDFELRFEFKISANGNSGVKYRTDDNGLGLEYQILDDQLNQDNKHATHRTASLYELKAAPDSKFQHPAGEGWNTARIISKGNLIEHWLNGDKVVSIEFGSDDWNERFGASKYRDIAGFAASPGPLLLQDHQHSVSFRYVRVRELP